MKTIRRKIWATCFSLVSLVGFLIPAFPGLIFFIPGMHFVFGERLEKYPIYKKTKNRLDLASLKLKKMFDL